MGNRGMGNRDRQRHFGARAFLAALALAAPASTQVCEQNVARWGGDGDDFALFAGVDSSGDFRLAGATDSYGAGGADLLLFATQASWDVSWVRTWGGSGDEELGDGCVESSSGALYACGRTDGFGVTGSDALLVKLDSGGSPLWARTWGANTEDFADGVCIDQSSGDVYLAGGTGAGGTRDALVLKYNSSGALQWTRAWGASGLDDSFNACAVDSSSGAVYAAGLTRSAGAGQLDVLLMKLDAAGNVAWVRTWGGATDDQAFAVEVEPSSGEVVVTGVETSFTGGSDEDALITRWDANGNLIWDLAWGSALEEGADGVTFDAAGNVYIAGAIDDLGPRTVEAFVLELDGSGALAWARSWGGPGEEGIARLHHAGDRLYTAGVITSHGGVLLDNATTLSDPSGSVSSPSTTTTAPSGTVQTVSGSITTPVADCGDGADVLMLTLDLGGDCVGTSYCQGSACPCGNDDVGAGCANSTGGGAVLTGSGSASVAADDLVLEVAYAPSNQNGIFFMARNQSAVVFGDGQLCAVSGIVRFGVRATDACGVVREGPGIAAAKGIAPGESWNFQFWYRDPGGPCGSAFNTSNGFNVVFEP